MNNRVAASLAVRDTESCLAALSWLAPMVAMAEVRLDLMESFDLRRLIAMSPCPLIVTCRAPREGGRFAGTEAERLDILREAIDLGCAYVDVEWDSVAKLRRARGGDTRLIASRHWHDCMPSSLLAAYESLRGEADAVKLVGLARRLADMFPVFDLMKRATDPVIGLAMGEQGRLTRLLGPCFAHCLLTYGAATRADVTAPGQYAVSEVVELYHLNAVGAHTSVHLHLCASPESANAIVDKNSVAEPGRMLHVPIIACADEADELARGLREYLPHLRVSADRQLSLALPEL